MKFGIVVDSSSDLRLEDFKAPDIDFTVVPLKIITDNDEYIDNNEVNIDQLLSSMEKSKVSSSSCPSPYDFQEAYRKSENVISITMTSALSGTYNSARLAADLEKTENPEKNIGVLDSKATAGSLVLLVNKAIDLIHQGLSHQEIMEALETYNQSLHLIFTLGSYDNLVKTGRMSNFVKTVAVAMHIKVVCEASPLGEINITKKVRGTNRLFTAMIESIAHYKDLSDQTVYIHHCKNEANVATMVSLLKEKWPSVDVHVKDCKALTTFYAMPGGMLISF